MVEGATGDGEVRRGNEIGVVFGLTTVNLPGHA